MVTLMVPVCPGYLIATGASPVGKLNNTQQRDGQIAVMQAADRMNTAKSLMPKANTWYVGANIDGEPRNFSQFTGGFHRYREFCARVIADGWRGLVFERSLERWSA